MVGYDVMEKFLAKPNETLASHTKKLITNLDKLKELGYIKDENLYELVKKACYYHDLGKMNSEFQNRLKNNRKFDSTKEIGHNILSKYLLGAEYYNSDIKDIEEYALISSAILNHHNYTNHEVAIEKHSDILKDNLRDVLKKLFEGQDIENMIKHIFYYVELSSAEMQGRVQNSRSTGREQPIFKKYWMINGLLKKCDYSASASLEIEYENDFLELCLERLGNTFEYGWNSMQLFCKENQEKNLIIKGSTGLGKTEAALLWGGNSKLFYVLPLTTAINSMYKRFRDNLLEKDSVDKQLALLHGNTLSDYLEGSGLEENANDEFEKIMKYYNLTKNYALPLSITTPDQVFNCVYRYYGSEVILSTLAYSKIIIDEIQSYSADILCYLILGLQEAVKMGAKFAIITATLPPFVKDLLVKGKEGEDLSELMKFEEREFVNEIDRHNLCVLESKLNAEDIISRFRDSLNEDCSSKFLVVCNTIGRAQEIYNKLKDEFTDSEDIEVNLLHSKFSAKDRAEKEEQIIRDGKTEVNKKVIWISTQVVEASLDIDFDYLFTELSDLNSFFQRLGRVNRKGKKPTEKYNSYVYTEIDNKHLRYSDKKGFIDGAIYEISKEVLLLLGNGKISEKRKIELIDENFTTEKLKERNGIFLKDYQMYYDYVSSLAYKEVSIYEAKDKFRNIVSWNIIPSSSIEEYDELNSLITQLGEFDSEYENIKMNTRDLKEKSKLFDQLRRKKIEVVRDIKEYVVPVAGYDIKPAEITDNNQLELSRYEKVYIVDCLYDSEIGFIKKKKDKVYDNSQSINENQEDNSDRFL